VEQPTPQPCTSISPQPSTTPQPSATAPPSQPPSTANFQTTPQRLDVPTTSTAYEGQAKMQNGQVVEWIPALLPGFIFPIFFSSCFLFSFPFLFSLSLFSSHFLPDFFQLSFLFSSHPLPLHSIFFLFYSMQEVFQTSSLTVYNQVCKPGTRLSMSNMMEEMNSVLKKGISLILH
jgi:hypothetical protein